MIHQDSNHFFINSFGNLFLWYWPSHSFEKSFGIFFRACFSYFFGYAVVNAVWNSFGNFYELASKFYSGTSSLTFFYQVSLRFFGNIFEKFFGNSFTTALTNLSEIVLEFCFKNFYGNAFRFTAILLGISLVSPCNPLHGNSSYQIFGSPFRNSFGIFFERSFRNFFVNPSANFCWNLFDKPIGFCFGRKSEWIVVHWHFSIHFRHILDIFWTVLKKLNGEFSRARISLGKTFTFFMVRSWYCISFTYQFK